ncbi:MAG: glycoside hydrolase family 13 protein [Actinomycetota bacterium]
MSSAPPDWVADAVFYQILPDRFARSPRVPKPPRLEAWEAPPTHHGYKGGDLLGVVEHLDWLVDLGVNALYLNPIFQSASNHRYHAYDYLQVDPMLGGNEAFDVLVAAAHERGVRVVLDGVFNHTGRGFFPFHDVLENGADSPYLDWFTVYGTPINAYDLSRPPNYEAWWQLHALPKLNTANPQVREYLMGVAEHWIRRGADGWRLDVPEEIATPGFWEEFRARVRAVNPEAYLVGEIWRAAPEWTAAGDRFDGVVNYSLTESVLRFAAGGRIDPEVVAPVNLTLQPPLDAAGYCRALDRLLGIYPDAAQRGNLNLLGSHDTPRVLSMVGRDRDAVILAALLLFTFPGAPCIYYGDEIGMTGNHDPGARGAFPWEHPDSWDGSLLDAFRSLVLLRREHPVLRWGAYRHLAAEGTVYAFRRDLGADRLVVALNAGDASAGITVPWTSGSEELCWGRGKTRSEGGSLHFELPGRSGGVWRFREPR